MICCLPSHNRMCSNCWKLHKKKIQEDRDRQEGGGEESLVLQEEDQLLTMQLPLSLWYLTKGTMKTYMYDLSIYGLPGLFKTKMKNTIKKSKWKGKWKSPCTQFSPALLPAFAHWPTPGDKKTCPALSSPWSPYKSVNATNLYWLSQMIFFIKASRTWTSFP